MGGAGGGVAGVSGVASRWPVIAGSGAGGGRGAPVLRLWLHGRVEGVVRRRRHCHAALKVRRAQREQPVKDARMKPYSQQSNPADGDERADYIA